jgi:hypothetical protein
MRLERQAKRLALAPPERATKNGGRERLPEFPDCDPTGKRGQGPSDLSRNGGWNPDRAEETAEKIEPRDFGKSDQRAGVRNDRHSARLRLVDLAAKFLAAQLKVRDPLAPRTLDELVSGQGQKFSGSATRDQALAIQLQHDQFANGLLRWAANLFEDSDQFIVEIDANDSHGFFLSV